MNRIKRSGLYALSMFDGCLIKVSKGNVQWACCHGPKQKAYLQWKVDLLNSLLGGKKPVIREYKTKSGYVNCIAKKSDAYFNQMRRDIYPNGKRRFSRKTLDRLDERGLAIWLMDDGSVKPSINEKGWISSIRTTLSTCCSEEEAIIIKKYLDEVWDIKCRFSFDKKSSDGNQYSIVLNTTNSKLFGSLVYKFVPECMYYKIKFYSDMKSHECQPSLGNCPRCRKIMRSRVKGVCKFCYAKAYGKSYYLKNKE